MAKVVELKDRRKTRNELIAETKLARVQEALRTARKALEDLLEEERFLLKLLKGFKS